MTGSSRQTHGYVSRRRALTSTGTLDSRESRLLEGAESLSFLFDREGNLRCPVGVVLMLEGTLDPADAWISVKTQFASPEVHVWIVGLLKYVKKRYISDLEVSDEGEYWETGDIRILRDKMDFINRKIDQIASGLSSSRFGDVAGLSAEEIASRIGQILLEHKPDPPKTDGLE